MRLPAIVKGWRWAADYSRGKAGVRKDFNHRTHRRSRYAGGSRRARCACPADADRVQARKRPDLERAALTCATSATPV